MSKLSDINSVKSPLKLRSHGRDNRDCCDIWPSTLDSRVSDVTMSLLLDNVIGHSTKHITRPTQFEDRPLNFPVSFLSVNAKLMLPKPP